MLTVVAILIDKQVWAGLQVEYKQHKDTDNQILKVPDEVVEFLDAHQLELQTMIGMGKFVDYFRTKVVSWQNKLGLVVSFSFFYFFYFISFSFFLTIFFFFFSFFLLFRNQF